MSNKKRNKKYRGKDAATNAPVVKKFSIDPNRPAWKTWLDDNRGRVRRWLFLIGITLIIFWIFSLFAG